jgi:hypothetical protein
MPSFAKHGEPLDAFEDIGGIGCSTGLAQPAKMRQPGVGIRGQQFIQPGVLLRAKIGGQRPVCLATSPMAYRGGQTVEHGQGRGQNAPLSQFPQKRSDQHEAAICATR